MGVKSTRELTRSEAEALYWMLFDRLYPRHLHGQPDDIMLELMLMDLNDKVSQGEGFTNYRIIK